MVCEADVGALADSDSVTTRGRSGSHPSPAQHLVRLLREHAALIRIEELAFARVHGLSPAEVHSLAAFAGEPELTAKELTHRLGYCHSRLSHVLDSLEGRGLISRRINESDRRIIDVTLSGDGLDLAARLEAAVFSCYERPLRSEPRRATEAAAAVLARALAAAWPAATEQLRTRT